MQRQIGQTHGETPTIIHPSIQSMKHKTNTRRLLDAMEISSCAEEKNTVGVRSSLRSGHISEFPVPYILRLDESSRWFLWWLGFL